MPQGSRGHGASAVLGDITNVVHLRHEEVVREDPSREDSAQQSKRRRLSAKSPPLTLLAAQEDTARESLELDSEYTQDIYSVLSAEERALMPCPDYMDAQPGLNAKMRACLADWLVEVARNYNLKSETLFGAMNIVDRYLEKVKVPLSKLQLVGVAAMMIVAKFEEIDPPSVKDFIYLTDNGYDSQELLVMEVSILTALDFKVCSPTVVPFFERYQLVNKSNEKKRHLVQYFLELCLPNIKMLRYPPSHLAAAATLLSNKLLEKQSPEANGVKTSEQQPNWSQAMIEVTGYSEAVVKKCAREMCGLVEHAESSSLQAVHKKFSQSEYNCVAQITF